jgi:hypothetical protein
VNFKGEGSCTDVIEIKAGACRVLEGMHETGRGAAAVEEFSRSAREVLIRRVQNAPAQRHESRWLSGWLQRVKSYSRD